MHRLERFVIVVVLFLLSTTYGKTFSQEIIINEFYPGKNEQWVELYSKVNDPVDISGWFIDDSGGSQRFTIPDNTIINSNQFLVFESSLFNLNSSSQDEVRLINKDETVVDSFIYTPDSSLNISFGRIPDANGNWVKLQTFTKGSSNNSQSIIVDTPTPQPSPTSTPKPTVTPKTTKPTSVTANKTTSSNVLSSPTTTILVSRSTNVLSARTDPSISLRISQQRNFPTPKLVEDKLKDSKESEDIYVKSSSESKGLLFIISGVFIILSVAFLAFKDKILKLVIKK